TCIFGALLFAVAMFFAWYAKSTAETLVDIALGAMTILYGGILGGFLTPLLFRTRGNDRTVPAAMAAGVALGAFLYFHHVLLGLKEKVIEWPWAMLASTLVTITIASLGRRRR